LALGGFSLGGEDFNLGTLQAELVQGLFLLG
jgi:hypothetical protein